MVARGIESNSARKNMGRPVDWASLSPIHVSRVRLRKDVAQVDILDESVRIFGSSMGHGPRCTLHPRRLRYELQLPMVRCSPDCLGNPKGGFLKRLVVGVGRARESKAGA